MLQKPPYRITRYTPITRRFILKNMTTVDRKDATGIHDNSARPVFRTP